MAREKPQAIYSIDRAYWGQAEEKFLWTGDNYAYSQNVNIYESSKSFELSKDFTQVIFWTDPTNNINKILRLPNDIQSNAYFSADWKVYIDSWSWPALVYTMTWLDKNILNAITFTDLLVFFTATKVHKIEFTWDDFKTFASCTEDVLTFAAWYQWFSANESYNLPVYNYKDTLLYRGAGKYLYSSWNTLSAASTSETFRTWAKIVWLTFLNSNMKVYINYMNVASNLYFWREDVSDSTEYKNIVFKAVVSDGTTDYVVCSDGLYLFNWYAKTKLHNYNFSDFGKSWSNYYIPQNLLWLDPYFFYVSYNKTIFKFGRKFSDLRYAFSISSIETNNITSLVENTPIGWYIYYADDSDDVYVESSSTYKTEWYLEWIVFYGDSMEKKKKIDHVFEAFEIPTNTSIELYFSIDGAAYPWTANVVLPAQTTKWQLIAANELENYSYQRVQVKIVLKSNWSATPKQYEFTSVSEYLENWFN